ncbi:A-kinase anchor protein SPHKAP [Otolemur garnettii]|uniref:A-kinase anchor protein SPHKAP n=1 Tax=Otolemur garnettii TaxID=30611 RepID=UPI000C7EF3FE|nr:A-kinase anchor protein SPHKAP [Otolemur garnettii]
MWVVEPNSPTCLSAALPARRHSQESSTLESPLMHEVSDPQQGRGHRSSGSSLGGSITACKKVLRSNSLLESTDYWLQNQRTPCQIGFVEDKSENCASVCFVNLDVNKDESSTEHLQQKLVNVSPDLPKLINSMNVQQPKENEIVLLSGLASGNLQEDFEVSQCPWLPDICLVQCARGSRPNSTNCIIFEINKFLIGLELVQERQLHLETNILKLEDDTNCSLSSIEEDFLTASEHLEEESEAEESRNGYENINISANVLESKKSKESAQEEWNYKATLLHTLEDKYIGKYHTPWIKTERSLENPAENSALQSLDSLAKPLQGKGEAVGNERQATSYYSENFKGQVEKSQALHIPSDAYFSMMVKDVPSASDNAAEQSSDLQPGDQEDARNALPSVQDGEVTTGEYATNLAESVLQDAFIRLSQSQPTLPQEPAICVSGGSALLPSCCSTKDAVVSRSWNELPKIVIVQSPDGSDTVLDPGISSWPEPEVPVETSENSSRHPQSALEVALACAATVIGTISSPQATERLKMEQEALVSNLPLGGSAALQTQASHRAKDPPISDYSFPSALCGMTQVASAIAVCGLSEREEVTCPVAPTGFLPAAEASEATPPLHSLTTGSGVELGKEAIVEGLLKEAARVLTRPNTCGSIGDFIQSMNRRIIETASKPQTLCSENVLRSELAHTLSNIILKHSIDEVHQKNKTIDPSDGRHSAEVLDTLMESTNQLLFNVICFTFKKMSHIVQLGERPTVLSKETEGGVRPPAQAAGQTQTKATECSSCCPLSSAHSTSLVTDDLGDHMHPKQDHKGGLRPGFFKNLTLQSECSHRQPNSSAAKTAPKEIYLKRTVTENTESSHQTPRHGEKERRASFQAERSLAVGQCRRRSQDAEDAVSPDTQEKYHCATLVNNEARVHLSSLGDDLLLPAQSTPPAKPGDVYCIADFAEELAETVVSMATEIAAICLENSSGKQPWFCAWKRWQAQSYPRSRFLGSGDRWSRLKASSCESIPEEDLEARAYISSLGLTSTLSQPVSRASSVSKQSSCESITDEFSRFMVNQMESEGRGFELLLDYYAGKNASSILSSAIQQACRKSDHLDVRPSCPSKQSSTESITEEFYRYMLRDMERDGRDSTSSRRSSQDWTAGLLSPSLRSPLCYRQSSVPDSRSSCAGLTVSAPIKANSLDGFAQSCPQDFLNVQQVSGASSSGLCKSDSCLYRRGGTDHITNMLIHETWASSIKALMRKNKIIVDDSAPAAAEPTSGTFQGQRCANQSAAGRVCSGPALRVQESGGYPRKDSATESKHLSVSSPSQAAPLTSHDSLDCRKEASSCCDAVPPNHTRQSLCSREVPLIQIETDQREACAGETEHFLSKSSPLKEAEDRVNEEKVPDTVRGEDAAVSTCGNHGDSLDARDIPEAEVSPNARAPDGFPNPPSSSEESTGSWSQLANEDDNPDDTSSFLQLSERSLSNGNSSATSSLGIMDLDIYQESMPSSPMINELVEEKEILKGQSENIEERASELPVGPASHQRNLLVINFDLEPECPDAELRATLQWIAASELGIPTIYFKKSQENRIEKFLDVVRLVHQKSWKVGDIFHAVVQYCKMHEEQKDGHLSLFDWLLELG